MPAALLDAVERARFKQVALLLSKKANIGVRDERGQCLLMVALRIGSEQKRARMFEYLLRKGAPCLARDADGKGVLEWAIKLERVDQVRVLLDEALVDYNLAQRDRDGYTALHYAAMSGNIEIAQLVTDAYRRQSVGVDVTDSMGLTPLMHAQRLAYADIVAVLKRAGGNAGRSDFTYHLNTRDWERRGKAEQLVARQRAALKEISRLKIVGKLSEAARNLLQLRLDGGAATAAAASQPPPPVAAAAGYGGAGWRTLPLDGLSAPAGELDATLSPKASSSGCGGVHLLASSWPHARLARGASRRSLASDSSGCAEPPSATAIGELPAILEAYGWQKTDSYRSPAVVTLVTSTSRRPKSPPKVAAVAVAAAASAAAAAAAAAAVGSKTQGSRGGGIDAAAGRRNALGGGGDEFRPRLPSLSEQPERQPVLIRPAAAAAEPVRADA